MRSSSRQGIQACRPGHGVASHGNTGAGALRLQPLVRANKRYVKIRHQTWSRFGAAVSDETAQLVEYPSRTGRGACRWQPRRTSRAFSGARRGCLAEPTAVPASLSVTSVLQHRCCAAEGCRWLDPLEIQL